MRPHKTPTADQLNTLAGLALEAGPRRYEATRRALGLGQARPVDLPRQQVARLLAALQAAGSEPPAEAATPQNYFEKIHIQLLSPPPGAISTRQQAALTGLINRIGLVEYRHIKADLGLPDVSICRLTAKEAGQLIHRIKTHLKLSSRENRREY